jgi:hypothetical protein
MAYGRAWRRSGAIAAAMCTLQDESPRDESPNGKCDRRKHNRAIFDFHRGFP